MAPWAITVSPESLTLSRDAGGVGEREVTFTVTNAGARSVTGRASLEALGRASPEWLTLRGEVEREFEPGATFTFTVRVAPPPDAPAGAYAFRLNVVDVHRPDEGEVEGPEVAFEVPEPVEDDGPRRPRWLFALIAAIVLLGVAAAVIVPRLPFGRNEPPVLSTIEDQRTFVNLPAEVPFTVDDDTPGEVVIEASSSDPTLVANRNIVVNEGTTERSLTITPANGGVGRVEITLLARDPAGEEASTSFELVVARSFSTRRPRLTASDGADGDFFGSSVAIDGAFALVGASFRDGAAEDAGAAYVFRREGESWSEQAELTASDADELDRFGMSVALDGDHAAIAARFDDGAAEDAGAVYVFRREGESWSEQAKLTASDAREDALFGFDLAIRGDHLLIGAPGSFTGDVEGAAYVFQRQGDAWTEVAKLAPRAASANRRFGRAVALGEGHAVVGAPAAAGDAGDGVDGRAYVFTRRGTAWAQTDELSVPSSSGFGESVALDGDFLIIGAPDSDDEADGATGSAHLFERRGDAWRRTASLPTRELGPDVSFGAGVEISGPYALVSAVEITDDLDFTAFVHVFRRQDETWTEANVLSSRDLGGDVLISGAAISGAHMLIGAPVQEVDDVATGAVYAFVE